MKNDLRASTNIHDYLERIGAEPPPINDESLKEAKEKIIWVDSIEEAVEALEREDRERV